VTLECDGRLAYTSVLWDDFVETGARPVDTEDLVNECLKIAGTETAFIAVEQITRQVKVSFRSRSDLNVAEIAERFGGGGHRKASGAMLPGPPTRVLTEVLAVMKAALAEAVPVGTS
jgi:phosphoesterase RecJ-like protein